MDINGLKSGDASCYFAWKDPRSNFRPTKTNDPTHHANTVQSRTNYQKKPCQNIVPEKTVPEYSARKNRVHDILVEYFLENSITLSWTIRLIQNSSNFRQWILIIDNYQPCSDYALTQFSTPYFVQNWLIKCTSITPNSNMPVQMK